MANSPLPTPLQDLGARRFSFYPPIRNVEHNEWQYRRATWQEVVVVNTRTGEEALIPRACVGEVSIVDDPVVIVGLRRELEWRDGAIYPHRRLVIEFPVAVNDDGTQQTRRERPAPVVNIRLEPRAAKRRNTKVVVAVTLASIGCLVAADVVRRSVTRISTGDDYSSTVRRLGAPAGERTSGGFRMLFYPARRAVLVFRGSRYMGALGPEGQILESVTLPDRTSSAPLLRSLPRF